jgi:hypothetical protein
MERSFLPYTDDEHYEMAKYLASDPYGSNKDIWTRFQHDVCLLSPMCLDKRQLIPFL